MDIVRWEDDPPSDVDCMDILELLERGSRKTAAFDSTQLRVKKKIKECIKKILKHKRVYIEKNYGRDLNDRDDDVSPADYDVEPDEEEVPDPVNDLPIPGDVDVE